MTLLLDTSVLVDVLRGRADVAARMREHRPSELAVCSVVRAELLAGAARRDDGGATRIGVEAMLGPFASHPFDDAAADRFAPLKALLERSGLPIGTNDLLIASIAVARGLAVVTANLREFRRVPGLAVETWRAG